MHRAGTIIAFGCALVCMTGPASGFGQGSTGQTGSAGLAGATRATGVSRPAASSGVSPPPGMRGVSPSSASLPTLPIGIIDFYGLHHLDARRLRAELTFKEGDRVPLGDHAFFAASERRLSAVPDVLQAHSEVVCCADGRLIVYVGIEERGAPTLRFRPAPTGSVRLPPEVVRTGAQFNRVVLNAVLQGRTAEDDSAGYMILSDVPTARPVENRVIELARRDESPLRRVLRESSDADDRALAAQFLGYAPDEQSVVPDLVYAMSDPSGGVRNNAMRALLVFTRATKTPAPRVPYEPFLALLESPVWTDRNKASLALLSLARRRDPTLLAMLRERAPGPLVEMARWKYPGHASPALWILGYIAGLPDGDIRRAARDGARDTIIEAALRR